MKYRFDLGKHGGKTDGIGLLGDVGLDERIVLRAVLKLKMVCLWVGLI
jgi:hypothetical protein